MIPVVTSKTSRAEPVLELSSIGRRFGRAWPLRSVSLSLAAGEAVAIVGRNGSGKTTMLRLIATALRPTRGTGRVDGLDLVRDARLVREKVGLLGHANGLYPDLTARENLSFSLRMSGQPASVIPIERALDAVGLAQEADRRVRTFSSGMQRRVALARLSLSCPSVLLLDEPYASFDSEAIEMVDVLVSAAAARGAAIVIATHDPDRAARVVDRVMRIENGILVDAGWPQFEIGSPRSSQLPSAMLAASGTPR